MRPFIFATLAAGVLFAAPITVPQIYSWVLYPGDTAYKSQVTQIEWPLTMTRDKTAVNHVGIDPGVFGMIVQLDGKIIGTRGTLNLVSGPGIALTAIDSAAGVTVQVSVAGGCTFDENRNSVCPGSGTAQTPVVIPANSPVKP